MKLEKYTAIREEFHALTTIPVFEMEMKNGEFLLFDIAFHENFVFMGWDWQSYGEPNVSGGIEILETGIKVTLEDLEDLNCETLDDIILALSEEADQYLIDYNLFPI